MLSLKKGNDKQLEYDKNIYKIEKVYDCNHISMLKVLDIRERICKALFYDEAGRLSNMSLYNPISGKEIKNITYKNDGKTISSIRVYNEKNNKLLKVAFFKPDGKRISSVIEYNSDGSETKCYLFCDDGEIIEFEV